MLWLWIDILSYTCINLAEVHDSSIQLNHRSLHLRVNLEELWWTILHKDLQEFLNLFRNYCSHAHIDLNFLIRLQSQRVLIQSNLISFLGQEWLVEHQTGSWAFLSLLSLNLLHADHVVKVQLSVVGVLQQNFSCDGTGVFDFNFVIGLRVDLDQAVIDNWIIASNYRSLEAALDLEWNWCSILDLDIEECHALPSLFGLCNHLEIDLIISSIDNAVDYTAWGGL